MIKLSLESEGASMRAVTAFYSLLFGLLLGSNTLESAPVLRIPMYAVDFPYEGTQFRKDGQWLALRDAGASDSVAAPLDLADGVYDVTLFVVGENDGRPSYRVDLNGTNLGAFRSPLASSTTEEGERFQKTWNGVRIARGDVVRVSANAHSENGTDIAWGRWSKLVFSRPLGEVGETAVLQTLESGVYGEMKKWHRITLAYVGPARGTLGPESFRGLSLGR